jgi:hypothetical protein
MRVRHIEMVHARCPVQPDVFDYYEVEARATAIIEVEKLRAAQKRSAGDIVFQEDLAQRLADEVGAVIVLRGMHQTTRSEVVCRPRR